MKKGQAVLALLVGAAVVGAGISAQHLGPKPPPAAPRGTATSGAWFCPHGGGEGWTGALEIANPGSEAVQVRITSYGPDDPSSPKTMDLTAGSTERVVVPVSDRGSSSMVEYFGGWVAAGWVTTAGGDESGVAAEACLPEAGQRFYLPDGTTEKGQDSYIVVMNPFAADAVVSLRILTAKDRPVTTTEITDYPLKPNHSVAFHMNQVQLLDTASVELTATRGRVAAASLGISSYGGIRSAAGLASTANRWILPGGLDTNSASVVVMNPTDANSDITASVYTDASEQTAAGAEHQGIEPERAGTLTVVTSSPSTLDLRSDGGGVIAIRRTGGIGGDVGSTAGVSAPASSWVVLPAIGAAPYDVRLLIVDPGGVDAKVTLSLLGANGVEGSPLTLNVPSHRTVLVPIDFVTRAPLDAVRIEASQGVVVPVFVAYSSDHAGYAVSAGVPMP